MTDRVKAAAVKRYHAHSFFPVVKSYNHAMVSRANEPLELNATEFGPENGEDLISSDRVSTTVTKGTSGCKAQDNTFSIKAYVEEAKSADNVTFCLSFVMEGETKRDHKVKRNTFLTLKRRLATTGGKLVFDIGKLENRKEICA